MIKKFLRLIRTLIIGTIWTYVFLVLSHFIMLLLWNFNIFALADWQTIARYWNSGGAIKVARDYAFLGCIILLPILWIWGWRRLNKTGYLELFLAPVQAYNRWIIRRYGSNSSRILLKNLKSSQNNLEDLKMQLEAIKPGKPTEVVNIREEIQKKIESGTSKY